LGIDFYRMLDREPEGYESLCWVLYVVSFLMAVFSLGPVSGAPLLQDCLLVFVVIVAIVLASKREKDAAGTIFESHLGNIRMTMTVNLIATLALTAFAWVTLGVGIVLTWKIYLCVLVWTGFKLIRGLMKLNDGVGY